MLPFRQLVSLLFHELWLGMKFMSMEQGASKTQKLALRYRPTITRYVNGAYNADCEVTETAESTNNEDDEM